MSLVSLLKKIIHERGYPLSMSIEEYKWLHRIARDAEPPFLEVGTHYGVSALIMHTANPTAPIYTVDNLIDYGGDKPGAMPSDCGILVKNIEQVHLRIGDSKQVVPKLVEEHSFGLALLDGSHWKEDVLADLKNTENIPVVLIHDAGAGGPLDALEIFQSLDIIHQQFEMLPAAKTDLPFDIDVNGLAIIDRRNKHDRF